MFELKKICDEYEKLSTVEKGVMLTESATRVMARLYFAEVPKVEAEQILFGFILGAIVADGKIDEREYLLMYPAMVRVFGNDFDFASVKQAFAEANAAAKQYAKRMAQLFATFDEDMQADMATLCLCVLAIDGKVSLKEKRYLRKLCNG